MGKCKLCGGKVKKGRFYEPTLIGPRGGGCYLPYMCTQCHQKLEWYQVDFYKNVKNNKNI